MIPEAPHQIKRLLRRPLLRQAQRVLPHLLLYRLAHVLPGAEKTVCRHQPFQCLMRPLEVIAFDIQLQSPRQVEEIRKHRLRKKFIPQRLPETLDLTQRLRMLGPRLEVLDPLPLQLVFKFRLSAPGRVLTPVVGQYFARRSKAADRCIQRLRHQV